FSSTVNLAMVLSPPVRSHGRDLTNLVRLHNEKWILLAQCKKISISNSFFPNWVVGCRASYTPSFIGKNNQVSA
ncbi:MAG: hypothetical protein AAGL24_13335, partial [Pseudomonadota bacterium]